MNFSREFVDKIWQLVDKDDIAENGVDNTYDLLILMKEFKNPITIQNNIN